MFNEERLSKILPVSGLGEPLFYFREVASTNDIAIDLANQGGSHGTLVIAERQTAGRGHRGKKWTTVPGSGLAMSIILKPSSLTGEDWIKYHALGALAVVEALEKYGLEARIKWPNDVLLQGKKVAGILAELSWVGERVEYVVLGIGVNICCDPLLKDKEFDLPAISIEDALEEQIDWDELLGRILSELGSWYSQIYQTQFIEEWEKRLAYRGEKVVVTVHDGKWVGRVIGLNSKGILHIESDQGLFEVKNGQTQMRYIEE